MRGLGGDAWPGDVAPAGRDPAGFAALQLGRAARLLDPGAGAPGAAWSGSGEGHGPDEDLLDAPETLRTLLRDPDAHGLRDRSALLSRRTGSPSMPPQNSSLTRTADGGVDGMVKTVAMPARKTVAWTSAIRALTAFLDDVEGRWLGAR